MERHSRTSRRFALLPVVLAIAACGGEAGEASPTYLGASPGVWAERLASSDFRVQEDTMTRLAALRPDVVPVLTALLVHSAPAVRAGATRAFASIVEELPKLGPARRGEFLPLLEFAVARTDKILVQTGLEGIEALGSEAIGARDLLVRLLAVRSPELRMRAAEALLAVDPSADVVTAAVLPYLGDAVHRERAREVLDRAGAAAVPVLVDAVNGEDGEARAAAIHALGLLGERAEPAVPALTALFTDEDPMLRGRAALAVIRIHPGDEGVIDALDGLLDEAAEVRDLAARALVGAGDAGVEVLRRRLDDTDPAVRVVAARFLVLTGHDFERGLGVLVAVLGADDEHAREIAGETFWVLDAKAAPAVPELIRILEAGHRGSRIDAAIVLGRIGTAAGAAVPALEKMAEKDHPEAQAAAREALDRVRGD